MTEILVAAVQFKPSRSRVEENRERLSGLVRVAAKSGAEIVVLPEMCNSGYLFPDRESILPSCEPRKGPTEQAFTALVKELGITLAYGWPEIEAGTGRLFNSATILFSDERPPVYYRKRLLYDADTTWAEPGDTPYPEWATPAGFSVTLGICMDLNDERFLEHLRNSQARLCLFPTNWLDQDFIVWNYWAYQLQQTRACLVAANNYGVEDETAFRGESAILDGRVLLAHAAATGDDIVLARVPLEPR